MAMMSWPYGMGYGSGFWPFGAVLGGAAIIVGILLIAFWIWMIVDVAKRKFPNQAEKIIWIVVTVLIWIFGLPIGALVYLIVVKNLNPKGLAKK